MAKTPKVALLLQVLLLLHANASKRGQTGFCNTQPNSPKFVYDLRCSRHNYTDFRDTHWFEVSGQLNLNDNMHTCVLSECRAPHKCMDEICPTNKTRECLDDCVNNHADKGHRYYPIPPCYYLPSELDGQYKIPSIYTLRISDELFKRCPCMGKNSCIQLQNLIFMREWRKNPAIEGISGPEEFFHEIEKSMDWCNDKQNGRMYNGTYVLCREESDVWRVMAEIGSRATHCIRYYIQKNFMKQKESGEFKKDMREICANFETEVQKDPEAAKTHTTERHSVEVNTYNACCFLMKSGLVERFNCTGESTTRYPNTPAPTVEQELRVEGDLRVYDDSFLSSAIISKTIAFCVAICLLLCKC